MLTMLCWGVVALCAHPQYGKTALMHASKKGHVDVAKLLIEKGAKVDAADRVGFKLGSERSCDWCQLCICCGVV